MDSWGQDQSQICRHLKLTGFQGPSLKEKSVTCQMQTESQSLGGAVGVTSPEA
jgi:hypothetical protein